MKATFNGVDGTSGYATGTQYTILVNENCDCNFYVVVVEENFIGEIKYTTVIDFFSDWKNLKY